MVVDILLVVFSGLAFILSVKNYAKAAVMIDFNPAIQTHIGTINMLDMNATPINVIGKDWIILGSISELTQAEFSDSKAWFSIDYYIGRRYENAIRQIKIHNGTAVIPLNSGDGNAWFH